MVLFVFVPPHYQIYNDDEFGGTEGQTKKAITKYEGRTIWLCAEAIFLANFSLAFGNIGTTLTLLAGNSSEKTGFNSARVLQSTQPIQNLHRCLFHGLSTRTSTLSIKIIPYLLGNKEDGWRLEHCTKGNTYGKNFFYSHWKYP